MSKKKNKRLVRCKNQISISLLQYYSEFVTISLNKTLKQPPKFL